MIYIDIDDIDIGVQLPPNQFHEFNLSAMSQRFSPGSPSMRRNSPRTRKDGSTIRPK